MAAPRGALTQAGVLKEDAEVYAEGVGRGGTLVSAKVADAGRARLDTILNRSAVDLQSRRAAWQKSGWKRQKLIRLTKSAKSARSTVSAYKKEVWVYQAPLRRAVDFRKWEVQCAFPAKSKSPTGPLSGPLPKMRPAGGGVGIDPGEGRTRTPEPLMFAAVHVGQSLTHQVIP
jgi:hypothetical protein